ncbi:MAG: hypothetical protein A2045_05045 [Rhodocyclales bacterium GWA2_65_20]|nr:MAG: hypothetical protein A2045_05045 [Rhodocyclales bacterium GWA2_65_20]
MTVATDDFLRRTRALVSALGLLQRSQPGSEGYAGFRRKLEKCVRLVTGNANGLLREALGMADAPNRDLLERASERGLLDAGEAERWSGYFVGILPNDDGAYPEETLVKLRAFAVDARGLEIALRNA